MTCWYNTHKTGTYHYYGTDVNGYPFYTHPSSGATFEVSIDFVTLDLEIAYNNDLNFWSASSNEDGGVEITSDNRFSIEESFFDGTDSNLYSGGIYPIQLQATFDDCSYYGFDYVPDIDDVTCPNYDTTVYDNCGITVNPFCQDCQPWGCASCMEGYYKMDLFMACQSCTQNYPNCATCNDWQGCTSCQSGYTLVWEPLCMDHVCQ